MMAANGSKKQKYRAQAHRDAAEGMSRAKNRQTQIHAQGKRAPRMKMLGTRAWLKALAAAEESLTEFRQSFLIARASSRLLCAIGAFQQCCGACQLDRRPRASDCKSDAAAANLIF